MSIMENELKELLSVMTEDLNLTSIRKNTCRFKRHAVTFKRSISLLPLTAQSGKLLVNAKLSTCQALIGWKEPK